LVDTRYFADRYGCEAAGKALRPGRATQAGGRHADDGAGDRNAALAENDSRGDDPLDTQAGVGELVHQPQQHSSERHRPIVATTTSRSRSGRLAAPVARAQIEVRHTRFGVLCA
jgi:hypothetical protein